MSDTNRPTKPPAGEDVDGNGMNEMVPGGFESPDTLYREFTKRPDVGEILDRLATWQPAGDERSGCDEASIPRP